MTGPRPPQPPRKGSSLHMVLGAVLVVVGLALSLIGLARLVITLDGGGYGSSAMLAALVILGAAGASLSAGIALVIWEIARRYE